VTSMPRLVMITLAGKSHGATPVSGYMKENGSYVVSQDIYWCETMYGKCLHKRTNQRLNHYMRRGVTGNTTYLGGKWRAVYRLSH